MVHGGRVSLMLNAMVQLVLSAYLCAELAAQAGDPVVVGIAVVGHITCWSKGTLLLS
jgi:hypothetical protein